MYSRFTSTSEPPFTLQPSFSRSLTKRVRFTKKIRTVQGVSQFIALQRANSPYVWDKRKEHYYIEWWEGQRLFLQLAGQTPTQATEAQPLFAGVDLNGTANTPDDNLNGAIYGMKAKDVLSGAVVSILLA